MKLVWHAENLREADWLRDMLGDLVTAEVIDLDMTVFDDDCIHIVSGNWRPLPHFDSYFSECRRRCKRLIRFHVSDEYYSGGYALYRHFDLVLRNFQTYLASGPGILTIPEGYPNGTRAGAVFPPAADRRYAWSFIGEIKASRIAMVRAFETFQPFYLRRTTSISDLTGFKVSKAEFDEVLENSAFSPCPMGNVILETWRFYESLELGCIPLPETRANLDYFTNMFGPNPAPSFTNWFAARQFAQNLFADKPALNRLQSEIGNWWSSEKARIRSELRSAILGPSHVEELRRFAAYPRNRFRVLHEPLRLLELMRHQNVSSLARRLARLSAPIMRIFRPSLS